MVVLVRYFGDTSWCPGMAGHGSTIISVFVFIMSSRREGGRGREGKGGEGKEEKKNKRKGNRKANMNRTDKERDGGRG